MTRVLVFLLLATTALACKEDSPCPAGQQIEKGYCTKQDVPADSAIAAADASSATSEGALDAAVPVDGDPGLTSEAGGGAAIFGKDCTGQAECGGDVSYCALQPGVPVGYCTAPGCDTKPQICPVGWSCFNVGVFKPGEPYVCLRP